MKLTIEQKRALLKRVADIYEMAGIAGVAVGLFQNSEIGTWVGLGFIAICLFLTYILER